MKALLLAAGFGTRLRPLTDTIPKCLVPIQQQPLLGRWLDLLFSVHAPVFPRDSNPFTPESLSVDPADKHAGRRAKQITHVLINTHYLPDVVRAFVQTSPWKEHITLVHEPELLGTAGTILHNADSLQDGAFILAHADNLTRFNPEAFICAHQQRQPGVEITMMTFTTDTPHSCGIVELNQHNIVMKFHEKSPENHGNHANAAVYIVEPSVINFLRSLNKKIIDFSTEVIPHYLGRMQTYHNDDYHRDIGTPQSLQLAELEF